MIGKTNTMANANGRRTGALLCLVAAAALMALALAGCGGSGASSSTGAAAGAASGAGASATATQSAAESAAYTTTATGEFASGTHAATFKVKGYGSFTAELDADAAPVTVANFAQLANDKYYDGLAFYRVVDKFCLQGGTKGNSASGNDASLTPIVGEFSSNGRDNALADEFGKGTLAMARTTDPNSATSTFFITLASGSSVSGALDGQYAAFGTIDKQGMKVVDEIVDDCKDSKSDSMGVLANEKDMPVIESIRVK